MKHDSNMCDEMVASCAKVDVDNRSFVLQATLGGAKVQVPLLTPR